MSCDFSYCTSMCWSGACVLLGCSDGVAREVDANVIIVEANQEAHSFEDEDSTVLFSTKLLVSNGHFHHI